MSEHEFTPDDAMTIAAARCLTDGAVCFVGIGLPSTAANLARRTHAPNLVLVYESGTLGSKPQRLPLSIGAQIDRFGNINSTVIGDYETPKVRLPGAGGAPEIAASCREVMVMLRQSPRAFVERVDFVSSMGYGQGPGDRERLGLRGAGPRTVVTDVGILRPDEQTCELTLVALQPGATAEQAREATGWNLAVADDIEKLEPPTAEELAVLRELQATIAGERSA